MTIEVLVARWLAVFWIVCGLSHALHPDRWAALLFPLREKEWGGFVLAGTGLPFGLVIVLGHDVWVWDVPVIVTLAGWMTTLKCTAYLLFPHAHRFVIRSAEGPDPARSGRVFRAVGIVMVALGAVVAWDAFVRR